MKSSTLLSFSFIQQYKEDFISDKNNYQIKLWLLYLNSEDFYLENVIIY